MLPLRRNPSNHYSYFLMSTISIRICYFREKKKESILIANTTHHAANTRDRYHCTDVRTEAQKVSNQTEVTGSGQWSGPQGLLTSSAGLPLECLGFLCSDRDSCSSACAAVRVPFPHLKHPPLLCPIPCVCLPCRVTVLERTVHTQLSSQKQGSLPSVPTSSFLRSLALTCFSDLYVLPPDALTIQLLLTLHVTAESRKWMWWFPVQSHFAGSNTSVSHVLSCFVHQGEVSALLTGQGYNSGYWAGGMRLVPAEMCWSTNYRPDIEGTVQKKRMENILLINVINRLHVEMATF